MRRLDIRNMALIAVMTALVYTFGPMSIPIGAVPSSLTSLLVYPAAYIFGMWNGTVTYLVCLPIDFVGAPVTSGYSGGPIKILGPAGGYLMVFILIALMVGFVVEHFYQNIPLQTVAMFVTLTICYAVGIVWFVGQTKMALSEALAVCVYPFVPPDCVKLDLVIIIGCPVRERLYGFPQARSVANLA